MRDHTLPPCTSARLVQVQGVVQVGPRRTRNGLARCPAAEALMRSARRRSRVAGCLALMTQKVATRRYDGGAAWKKAQARGSTRR